MAIPEKQVLQRYSDVVSTLAKHGFGFLLTKMRLGKYIPIKERLGLEMPEDFVVSRGVRARRVLEDLGPLYIKFGQILSTRPDLLPRDIIEEFSKLVDHAPAVPFSEVKAQIESQFKMPLNEVFREFNEQPIASSSLSQVHEAKTLEGDRVVVKVLRKNVEEHIKIDLEALRILAGTAEATITEAKKINLSNILAEYSRAVSKETNLLREARMYTRFRENFKGDKDVVIPDVHWDYTTRKVLTLNKIHGTPLTQWMKKRVSKKTREKIARKGTAIYLKQIFEDGLFQADPHAGNLFIIGADKIGIIDFGLVGTIGPQARKSLSRLLYAVTARDVDKAVTEIMTIAALTADAKPQEIRRELSDLVENFYDVSLKEVPLNEFMQEVQEMIEKFNMVLPPEFSILFKTVVEIEGLGREIDPGFNFTRASKSYFIKALRSRVTAEQLVEIGRETLLDTTQLLRILPKRFDRITERLSEGVIPIEFEHRGLE